MSNARKAHQNHQYAMAHCQIYENKPKRTKIVKPTNDHFPKVNQDLSTETMPYLDKVFEYLMKKKVDGAMDKVEQSKKKLRGITKDIAKADRLPAIKNQPNLDIFVTPARK